jgi:hypothetical protein
MDAKEVESITIIIIVIEYLNNNGNSNSKKARFLLLTSFYLNFLDMLKKLG